MTTKVIGLDDDCIAWITVRMHSTGTVSVNGMIADRAFALKLLDHARDAITRQVPAGGLLIPNRDVDLDPHPGLRDVGDLAPHERGDS